MRSGVLSRRLRSVAACMRAGRYTGGWIFAPLLLVLAGVAECEMTRLVDASIQHIEVRARFLALTEEMKRAAMVVTQRHR